MQSPWRVGPPKDQGSSELILHEGSNFYKFMMSQDSDKLARIFLEAEPKSKDSNVDSTVIVNYIELGARIWYSERKNVNKSM